MKTSIKSIINVRVIVIIVLLIAISLLNPAIDTVDARTKEQPAPLCDDEGLGVEDPESSAQSGHPEEPSQPEQPSD